MTSDATVRLLIATDFDGTVAPIQLRPELVALDPRFAEFFAALSNHADLALAFISGRDLADLTARTSAMRAWRSGSHGHEIAASDGAIVRGGEAWVGEVDADWLADAEAAGIRLERKRFGIAAHWRGAESIAPDHPLIRQFTEWALRQQLKIVEGRAVVEATVPGSSKREVLEFLATSTGARRVLYAGDDLTDIDALAWAATRGRGFFVTSDERQEQLPPGVEPVSGRGELLDRFREEAAASGG